MLHKTFKKTFLSVGMILAVLTTLTNCTKEEEQTPMVPEKPSDGKLELVANILKTKTVNEGLDTKWESNDAIAVFYGDASADPKTYSKGLVLKCDDAATGVFKGTLDEETPLAANNDWYAFYSSAIKTDGTLNAKFTTPEHSSALAIGANVHYTNPQVQKQTDLDNLKHIAGTNYPLAGIAKNVAKGTKPTIEMQHISSFLELVVTNNSPAELTVKDIEVETDATPIVGLFNCGFTNGELTVEAVPGNSSYGNPNASNIASLEVVKGKDASSTVTIEKGNSAKFYLAVAPFTAKAGENLKVRVNGYEILIPHDKDMSYASGKINTIPCNFDAKPKDLTAGTYVIAAKKEDGSMFAMLNTPISSRLDQLEIGVIEDLEATYVAEDKAVLWDVVKTADGFNIKDQDGKYLSWTPGNKAVIDDKAFALNAEGSFAGYFTVQFTEPEGTEVRALAWNESSKGFAFYKLASTTLDTEIYFIPAELTKKTALAAPVVTATPDGSNAKITVTWEAVPNATSYEVTCTGQTAVNVTATTAEFTGLALGEKYEITVTAKGDETKYLPTTSKAVKVELLAAGTKSFIMNIKKELTGDVPTGVTAEFTNTSNATQITVDKNTKIGKNQVYTIKGLAGKTITGLSLSSRSNKSSGAAAIELKAGTTVLAKIGEINDITKAVDTPEGPKGVNFDNELWNGQWTTEYVDVNVAMSNKAYTIKSGEDVVLTIVATVNSIYCQNITIQYTE